MLPQQIMPFLLNVLQLLLQPFFKTTLNFLRYERELLNVSAVPSAASFFTCPTSSCFHRSRALPPLPCPNLPPDHFLFSPGHFAPPALLLRFVYETTQPTCRSLEFAVCFLVSFPATTQTCFRCSFHAFAVACLNFSLNLCQCPWGSRVLVSVRFHFDIPLPSVLVFHMSCSSHLCTNNHIFDVSGFHSSGTFAPVNTALIECLAMPLVLPISSGCQALADHVVTFR